MNANPTQNLPAVRILLLDESILFRVTLARFLAAQDNFEVAAECSSSAEALESLKSGAINLVLSDIDSCSEDKGGFIASAREAGFQGRFLIIAATLEAHKLAFTLRHGVSGVVLKTDALNRLVDAVRQVAMGEAWMDRRVILALANSLADRLDETGQQNGSQSREDRERNVLLGILSGLSNRKIADGLGLSESAVKYIVQRLFTKAGVKTRSQLVRVSVERTLSAEQTREHGSVDTHGQSAAGSIG